MSLKIKQPFYCIRVYKIQLWMQHYDYYSADYNEICRIVDLLMHLADFTSDFDIIKSQQLLMQGYTLKFRSYDSLVRFELRMEKRECTR